MNNIEILENAIKCNKKQFEELGVHILLQDDEMEALENLIKENKELKRKLQEHICIEAHEQVKQLYVPKSKVKEIAKKYEFALNGYDSSTADYKQSQDLGRYMACIELLNEGE